MILCGKNHCSKHRKRMKNVRVLTNGCLITKQWAAWLADHPRIHLQISLDGPVAEVHDRNRGKGSYEATVSAVNHLRNAGLTDRVTLCMTLMKDNIRWAPGSGIFPAARTAESSWAAT